MSNNSTKAPVSMKAADLQPNDQRQHHQRSAVCRCEHVHDFACEKSPPPSKPSLRSQPQSSPTRMRPKNPTTGKMMRNIDEPFF